MARVPLPVGPFFAPEMIPKSGLRVLIKINQDHRTRDMKNLCADIGLSVCSVAVFRMNKSRSKRVC